MKHISTLTLLIALLFSYYSWSQYGGILVNIDAYSYGEASCYHLTVSQGKDTVYFKKITDADEFDFNEIQIDSLEVGSYFVSLENCGIPKTDLIESTKMMVEVEENKFTHVFFDMNHYPTYSQIDEETRDEIVESRMEYEFEYSYFDFRWNPDGNNPKFNLGFGGSFYTWQSFSKHVGFLVGGGYGWNLAQLQIDEDTEAIYPGEVKSNYYNYIYGKFDMKLRFSTLNQQKSELDGHNVFLDLGAQYNLPVYFKRVTRFDVHDKLVNSFIHRFSDVRFYANLGFTNFQLFASYRPFDFINKELPQFPRYDVGVKFNIHD